MADHTEMIVPGAHEVDYSVASYGWPAQFYDVEYGSQDIAPHHEGGMEFTLFAVFLTLDVLLWFLILILVAITSEWLVRRLGVASKKAR